MLRSIQNRITRRVESLKKKTVAQSALEKTIRGFLVKEFGPIGETLSFGASHENKKLRIWIENKTAGNEIALRSLKLGEALKANNIRVEIISVE